jgi:hypothetical protein
MALLSQNGPSRTASILWWGLLPLSVALLVYWARMWTVGAPSPTFANSVALIDFPPVIELGPRERGDVVLAQVRLANRGGKELIVSDIQSSCACSGLERESNGQFVAVESLRIPPNGQVDLVMRVVVQGTPGLPVSTGMSFSTNDSSHPTAHIEAHVSEVRAGVITVPSSVAFGKLQTYSDARQTVEVYGVSVKNPDNLSVRLVPLDESVPRSAPRGLGVLIGMFEVTARTSHPGSLETEVEIFISGERSAPSLLPVSGRVVGPIEVVPSIIVLPRSTSVGPTFVAHCSCKSVAGTQLALSVQSASDGLTTEIADCDGSECEKRVSIRWDGTLEREGKKGNRRYVRLIGVTNGAEVIVEIPVVCLRKGTP